MNRHIGNTVVGALALLVAACGSLPSHERQAYIAVDGVACVGEIGALPDGLVEVINAQVLGQAQGASEKGGICAGKTFVVDRPVRAYRVWDSAKSYTQLGRWWSFARPEGPKDGYRHDYAICPSWSALDHLVACDIKPGATIAVGPTQSAACDEGVYAKTAANQVYVPNDTRADKVFVDNCRDEGAWPTSGDPERR